VACNRRVVRMLAWPSLGKMGTVHSGMCPWSRHHILTQSCSRRRLATRHGQTIREWPRMCVLNGLTTQSIADGGLAQGPGPIGPTAGGYIRSPSDHWFDHQSGPQKSIESTENHQTHLPQPAEIRRRARPRLANGRARTPRARGEEVGVPLPSSLVITDTKTDIKTRTNKNTQRKKQTH
jgi:hypothetical protein